MPVPPEMPNPTPEYAALEPRDGEAPMDALARVGDEVLKEFGGGDPDKDTRKNKKMPRQLGALVALRAQGFDNAEIAQRLGVTPRKLTALIAKARKEYGWSDLGEKLAHVAMPRAVDNVVKHLEHEGSEAGVKSGTSVMTREMMKGFGVWKGHTAVKQTSKSEQTNVLRVEIAIPQLPSGDQGTAVAVAGVLATPRRSLPAIESHPTPAAIDAEVVES